MDARSIKGAWEAIVSYVNREKTTQIRTIAEQAQWFEDRMPWDPKYRKEGVHGVTANAIDIVIETGESGPMTPVGINLPNDQGIRERYGSKSVSLSNVNEAYDKSTLPEFRSEFSWTAEEAGRATRWSAFAGELTTNMHEVIGHGSGKVDERLKGSPQAALKEQFSAIEESRADLVALYFLARSEARGVRARAGRGARGDRPRRIRGLRAQCARAAAARARGDADRRRPHAQPPDDRPLADGAHHRDRRADARRQDLLRDDRSRRIPGRRRPPARRGAAHQGRGRLRGGARAVRRLRRALRSGAARRGGRARRSPAAAVLHRVRDAPARGGQQRVGRDHRRRDLVPARISPRRCSSTPRRRATCVRDDTDV